MPDVRTSSEKQVTRRPLRPLSTTVVCATLAGLFGAAFVGGGAPTLRDTAPDVEGCVTMGTRSRTWQGGRPNKAMIRSRKGKMPSVNNMKDTYFIVYCRSPKIKEWKPLNIVSGSEAMKTLKSATDNKIAKTVGVDKLAEGQVVKGIGMQLYKQKDEILDQARQMHPSIKYTENVQFGFKEIKNNTVFNDNPGQFMDMRNIELIPPEEELRNLLDDAGEAVEEVQSQVSKVGDQVKGFFSSGGN
ncbi:HHL1 [Symbiodinium natans]|uniref:HHL1 protein n=1 Tax=Symbiodinium natans TaxID=878477 RepID=A0A812TCR4_9DINO|nr:HHL1 [Symbiodinium natans]